MQVFLALLALAVTANAATFDYDSPDEQWPKLNIPNNQCGGNRQTGINIDRTKVIPKEILGKLQFKNYKIAFDGFIMVNTGHSAQFVDANSNTVRTVSGGPLGDDTYNLASIHCHWGLDDKSGSEHTIDGKASAMECHFVHVNTKYGTTDKIGNNSDGIVVIGVLIDVCSSPILNLLESIESIIDAFNPIAEAVGALTTAPDNSVERKEKIRIDRLFPSTNNQIYSYNGSLTTPPCTETVTWFVFARAVCISQEQMGKFRRLEYENKPIAPNFRPTQPLNNREVHGTVKCGKNIIGILVCSLINGLSNLLGLDQSLIKS